jgi:hypothetical protein
MTATAERTGYCLSCYTGNQDHDRKIEVDVINRFYEPAMEGPMRSPIAQVAADTASLIKRFDSDAYIGFGIDDGNLEASSTLSPQRMMDLVHLANYQLAEAMEGRK